MKHFCKYLISLVLVANYCYGFTSEWIDKDHSKVRIISSKETIAVEIKLKPGWKTYWHNSGNLGKAPEINIGKVANLSSFKIFYPPPLREEIEGLVSFVYKDTVILPIKLKLIDTQLPTFLPINFSYAVCNKLCAFANLDFNIEVAGQLVDEENELIIAKAFNHVTTNTNENYHFSDLKFITKENQTYAEVKITSNYVLKDTKLMLAGPVDLVFGQPKIVFSNNNKNILATFPMRILGDEKDSKGQVNLVLTTRHKAVEHSWQLPSFKAEEGVVAAAADNFVFILFYALIGGIILNFMPCVLPVLSLKLFSLVKQTSASNNIVRANIFATVAGIFVSFLFIALATIIFRALGMQIGFGLHFQQPAFLITIILILMLVSCSLFDLFTIHIPQWILNLMPINYRNDSLIGSFFTGALATTLSTPCTAPGLTIAISFAITASIIEILLVFSFIALGFALPYLLIFIHPNLLKVLPKPGIWMVKFKKILAILLFLTVLWFIYIISYQLGFLSALVVFLCCLLIKFVIEQDDGWLKYKISKIFCLLVIILVIYIIPIKIYHDDVQRKRLDDSLWLSFNEQQIPYFVSKNQVVVVDVTAQWCLSCKLNKLLNFENSKFISQIKSGKIIAMRADITKEMPAEIYNFMKRYDRYAIPFNIVFGPRAVNGIVLSELFFTNELTTAINKASLKYSDITP